MIPTKPRHAFAAVMAAALLAVLAACGGGAGGGGSVTVGSKNFTEQFILGEMYAQTLEANGYNVTTRLNLGSVEVADQALQNGDIDMYPEYTGTALETVLPYEEEETPDSPEATYEAARELYAERDMTLLPQASFNNTYGISVSRQLAEERNLQTLGDLEEASSELVFASFGEFQERDDGFPNIQENYPDMNFQDVRLVNELGLRYQALNQGDADVAVGFTTDGQLTSEDIAVMEDEQDIWPFYHPAPVVRSEWLDENPEAEEIINSVTESLDLETMRELNGRVDLQNEDPENVAREYLEEQGLLE